MSMPWALVSVSVYTVCNVCVCACVEVGREAGGALKMLECQAWLLSWRQWGAMDGWPRGAVPEQGADGGVGGAVWGALG